MGLRQLVQIITYPLPILVMDIKSAYLNLYNAIPSRLLTTVRSMNSSKNLIMRNWLLAATTLSITLMLCLFLMETAEDKSLLWARYTARISFFFFLISFIAGSIHYFFSNAFTRSIKSNRRYIGLSFALTHSVHLVALISFFITTNQNPDTITLAGGGLAYVAMYAMAFTSNDKAVKKIGFKKWKLIHQIGTNYTVSYTHLTLPTKA